MYGFKVRDRLTGEFLCKGGQWSKNGNIWNRLQDVKSSIKCSFEDDELMPQWELVVVALIPNTSISVRQAILLSQKDCVALAFKQYLEIQSTHS